MVISSLSNASQLSSKVSISSFSSSLCSLVSFSTHFCLLKLTAGGWAGAEAAGAAVELGLLDVVAPLAGVVLGAAKNDVMLAFCLGFLASEADSGPLALRLRVDMV